jgi:hypothetical protein
MGVGDCHERGVPADRLEVLEGANAEHGPEWRSFLSVVSDWDRERYLSLIA